MPKAEHNAFPCSRKDLHTLFFPLAAGAACVHAPPVIPSTLASCPWQVYADEARTTPVAKFYGLRQQAEKDGEEPYMCVSDFISPKGSGIADYIGAFACSAGHGLEKVVHGFKEAGVTYVCGGGLDVYWQACQYPPRGAVPRVRHVVGRVWCMGWGGAAGLVWHCITWCCCCELCCVCVCRGM